MNALVYTLGLDSSNFVSGANSAGRSLGNIMGNLGKLTGAGALIGSMFAGVKAGFNIVEGVEQSIKKGADLSDLSKQTGETVSNLYRLQKGLAAVGVDSASAGGMIFQLNKALGGINEDGVPTGEIFSQIGLNIAQLKAMNAPDAIQAIAKSIARLDNAGAANAAGKIFGRNQAQSFLQLARSGDDFAEALSKAKARGDFLERMATMFEKVEKSVSRLKTKLDPLFDNIARGVAPTILSITSALDKIDLSKIGKRIGDTFAVLGEAFKEGKVFELITTGFAAAAEFGGNVLVGTLGSSGLWSGIWNVAIGEMQIKLASVGKVLLGIGTLLKTVLIKALDETMEKLAQIPGVGKALGISDFKARSLADIYKEEKENAGPAQGMLSEMLKSGLGDYKSGATSIMEAIKKAIANSGGQEQEKFKVLYNSLLTKSLANFTTEQNTTNNPPPPPSPGEKMGEYKPSSTALEKLGFVFGGSGGSHDAASTTARNTGQLVTQMNRLINLWTGPDKAPSLTNTWC